MIFTLRVLEGDLTMSKIKMPQASGLVREMTDRQTEVSSRVGAEKERRDISENMRARLLQGVGKGIER